jgi:hypothetical protein
MFDATAGAIQHEAMVAMFKSTSRVATPARTSPSPPKERNSLDDAKHLQKMPQGRHRPSPTLATLLPAGMNDSSCSENGR